MKFFRQYGKTHFFGQMFLHISGDPGNHTLVLHSCLSFLRHPLFIQQYLQIINTNSKFFVINRFQNIIRDLQTKRLLTIREIIISGHNNKSNARMFDSAELDHLQSVHDRNIDIHDHNVRTKCIDPRQCLHSIGCFANNFTAMPFPVKQTFKSFSYHNFVIHQQYSKLFHRTFSPR